MDGRGSARQTGERRLAVTSHQMGGGAQGRRGSILFVLFSLWWTVCNTNGEIRETPPILRNAARPCRFSPSMRRASNPDPFGHQPGPPAQISPSSSPIFPSSPVMNIDKEKMFTPLDIEPQDACNQDASWLHSAESAPCTQTGAQQCQSPEQCRVSTRPVVFSLKGRYAFREVTMCASWSSWKDHFVLYHRHTPMNDNEDSVSLTDAEVTACMELQLPNGTHHFKVTTWYCGRSKFSCTRPAGTRTFCFWQSHHSHLPLPVTCSC